MRNETPLDDDSGRRRLNDADLTPDQRCAVEARRAERQTSEYQDELAWDVEVYRQEFPPVAGPDSIETLAGRRRKRNGLSRTGTDERTGSDRATSSKLETGKIASPPISAIAWTQSMSCSTLAAVVSVSLVPIVFLGIIITWAKIDGFLGSREVSRYIKDHQSVVSRRLSDPKVHSFTLTHNPSEWGALLIKFDVDDKATYEMLESDLNDIWNLRSPPQWRTIIRSNERLSNNYGYAALGFRELGEFFQQMLVAGLISLAQASLFIFIAVRCWYRRPLVD
jgi:hypothetical protein